MGRCEEIAAKFGNLIKIPQILRFRTRSHLRLKGRQRATPLPTSPLQLIMLSVNDHHHSHRHPSPLPPPQPCNRPCCLGFWASVCIPPELSNAQRVCVPSSLPDCLFSPLPVVCVMWWPLCRPSHSCARQCHRYRLLNCNLFSLIPVPKLVSQTPIPAMFT